jgi:subtilisin family serine protease
MLLVLLAPAPGASADTRQGLLVGTETGTSFAAAYVSGAAALLAAARPEASGARLREALVAAARRRGGFHGLVADGRLDVRAAVRRLVRAR